MWTEMHLKQADLTCIEVLPLRQNKHLAYRCAAAWEAKGVQGLFEG